MHDQIKQQLTQQQQAQQVPLFLQQLRSGAKIEVYDDRYKAAFPESAPTPPATPAATAAPAPASAAPAPAATKK